MATGPMITVHGPGFGHPAGVTVEVVGLMTKAGVPVVFERFLTHPGRYPGLSRAEVERWGNRPGSALVWALREGRVVYG